MEDFPSNSQYPTPARDPRAPEEPPRRSDKKIEKVVTGKVTIRKRSVGDRFRETFFGGEDRGIIGLVGQDVLIPALKDMVADTLREAIERSLFGESRNNARRSSGSGRSYGSTNQVNYTRYSSTPSRDENRFRDQPSRRSRNSRELQQFIVSSRAEADAILDQMELLLEKYELVSVSELYEMLDIVPLHTDQKWGWTNIRGAGVSRISHGEYRINLPRPEPID